MTLDEAHSIVEQCHYENFTIELSVSVRGAWYVQARWVERCIKSGEAEWQASRKWLVSEHMTKSELVQTVFKMCLTAMEHKVRETFKYRGKRVFGPHYDVDVLHDICTDENFDYRRDG